MKTARIVTQTPDLQQQLDELIGYVWHLEHTDREWRERHLFTVATAAVARKERKS